jgi:hypothetical protein
LAGRALAAAFFAGRFVAFLADFFAGRFADFPAARLAGFFFAVFRAAFGRFAAGRDGASRRGVAGIAGMARSAGRAGMANAGTGGGAGIGSLDIGESSIHPPLVQPVSISSCPDIGAPLARGAALPPPVKAPRRRCECVMRI